MSTLLNIEEKEKNVPIFCIFGGNSHLQKSLIEENCNKFRIIIVSLRRPKFLDGYPDIYFIPYENAQLLPKLEESIHYSVIFLTEKNLQPAKAFMEKVEKDKTKTIALSKVSKLSTNAPSLSDFAGIHTVKIALFDEVLTRKKTELGGDLSKIIDNAILKGVINVNGEQILPVYGITLHDFLLGINRLLFGNFKNENVYFLFYKNPQTALEAAHFIARVEPEIKIHFFDSPSAITLPTREAFEESVVSSLRKEGAYIDAFFDGFEKGARRLFDEKVDPEELEEKGRSQKISKKVKKIGSPLKFSLLSFLLGTVLFIFLTLLFLGAGLLLFKNSIDNLQSNNFGVAQKEAMLAKTFFSVINPTLELTFPLLNPIDKKGQIHESYQLVERGLELVQIAGSTISTLSKQSSISEKTITTSLANLSYLYQEGQRIALETGNESLKKQLSSPYAKLLSFSDVLPQLLGYDEEKEYLLLFQNNEELRPTGGFIGSIGNLTVKNGKVTKIAIQDVYELDGQLRNHIEPPFIVRRYLQPHLYLRDSNFYLNFQEGASTSAKLYNLETGREPDGVIAINLEVLRKIMEVTGPIPLPSYNVTVTKDSVSQFLQNTIKENFFPGSTQKKDVLNSLFTQLMEKSAKNQKFNIELLKLLPEMLEEKNILISLRDESVQKIFSANGYAGEQVDPRPRNAKTIQDFLYINEANIGVNKVNAAVSREIQYEAMIGQGKLSSLATLNLTNNSPTDDYTVYLQFVVPQQSTVKQITIDGIKQQLTSAIVDPQVYEAKDFIKPEGLEVEQNSRDGFTHIAFIAVAKKEKKTVVRVDYENGAGKNLSTIIDYSLLSIKQPGTNPYKLTTTIDYPEGYTPVATAADTFGKNFLEKTTTIRKDIMTNVTLQQ